MPVARVALNWLGIARLVGRLALLRLVWLRLVLRIGSVGIHLLGVAMGGCTGGITRPRRAATRVEPLPAIAALCRCILNRFGAIWTGFHDERTLSRIVVHVTLRVFRCSTYPSRKVDGLDLLRRPRRKNQIPIKCLNRSRCERFGCDPARL